MMVEVKEVGKHPGYTGVLLNHACAHLPFNVNMAVSKVYSGLLNKPKHLLSHQKFRLRLELGEGCFKPFHLQRATSCQLTCWSSFSATRNSRARNEGSSLMESQSIQVDQ